MSKKKKADAHDLIRAPVITEKSTLVSEHNQVVFKVAKENWVTPETINSQDKPATNFDRAWFDETSFGDTGLANSEKAWDRMGTALETELDSILYLHNLPRY